MLSTRKTWFFSEQKNNKLIFVYLFRCDDADILFYWTKNCIFRYIYVLRITAIEGEQGLSSAKRSKKITVKVVLLYLFCAFWRLTDTKHFLMCSTHYKCIKCKYIKCITNTSTPANCTKKLHLIEGFIRFCAAPPAVCHMN